VLRRVVALLGALIFVNLGVLAIATGQLPLLPPIVAALFGFLALIRDPTILDRTVRLSPDDRRRSMRSAMIAGVVVALGAITVAIALAADIDLLLLIGVFVYLVGLLFGVDAIGRRIPSELRRSPLGLNRRPRSD
jgi:Na+/proline symporter